MRLTEADAAYEWKIRPSSLGLCKPEEDITYMTAYLMTMRKMRSWDMKQAEKEARRQSQNRPRRRHR